MLKIIGGRSYEYESVRVNGKPVKRYLGPGPPADVAEAVTALARAEAAGRRAEFEAMAARDDELDSQVDDVVERAALVADAVLIAAGYWRPARKPWRKRRWPTA